jgi:uncharacterized membrane protein HdeD (DUF308 family)
MALLPMLDFFTKNWWVILLRGILAVLFGIMAFAMPTLTLLAILVLYGAFALVDGMSATWVGFTSHAWGLVWFGLLGIVVGIYTLFYPGITAIALLYLIAAWAIVRGICEIVTSIRLRKELVNEWVLILSGTLSIIVGLVLFARPSAGVLAMLWLIGVYALVTGLLLVVLAFRIRGLRTRFAHVAGAV